MTEGKPEPEWRLDCPACTNYLRKVKDPLWAAMPADIPETPDERTIREDAEKRGERALKKAQEETNIKLTGLTEQIVELLKAQHVPVNQEDIAALVAAEVAKAMNTPQFDPIPPVPVGEPAEEYPEPRPWKYPVGATQIEDLPKLHAQTLAKMCRERGLNDRGGKDELIARLTAE